MAFPGHPLEVFQSVFPPPVTSHAYPVFFFLCVYRGYSQCNPTMFYVVRFVSEFFVAFFFLQTSMKVSPTETETSRVRSFGWISVGGDMDTSAPMLGIRSCWCGNGKARRTCSSSRVTATGSTARRSGPPGGYARRGATITRWYRSCRCKRQRRDPGWRVLEWDRGRSAPVGLRPPHGGGDRYPAVRRSGGPFFLSLLTLETPSGTGA